MSIFQIRTLVLAVFACLVSTDQPLAAQSVGDVRPTVGLRQNAPTDCLLRDARLIARPDAYEHSDRVTTGDVLIQNGSIVAIGAAIEPPAGCEIVDCSGKTLYAGWINAWHEVGQEQSTAASDDYWNANIVPGRRVQELAKVPDAEKLRSQGFTTTVLAPPGRILGGQPSVWSLNESITGEDQSIHLGPQRLKDLDWLTAAMTVPRPNDAGEDYPRSPMGAIALLRQSIYDAKWYQSAIATYQANTTLPQPRTSESLGTLSQQIQNASFVFDAPNERMALRAGQIAGEFSLRAIIRGSGREYRAAGAIVAMGHPLLLPVDFPEPPNVATPAEAREVELRDLMHWRFAPTNPAKMIEQGATVCLTTDRLGDAGKFLAGVRKAVQHGMTRPETIAALTTNPAKLLGIDATHGRIAVGMVANLILTDGDLFDSKTKIQQTIVAGQRFEINHAADDELKFATGTWNCVPPRKTKSSVALVVEQSDGKLSVNLQIQPPAAKKKTETKAADEKSDDKKNPTIKLDLKKIVQQIDRLSAVVEIDAAAAKTTGDWGLSEGTHRVLILPTGGTIDQVSPDQPWSIEILPVGKPIVKLKTKWHAPEVKKTEPEKTADGESPPNSPLENSDVVAESSIPIVTPFGSFGREEPVSAPERVLFRGAIVWTCRDEPNLPVPTEPMDVLIENGKIVAIEKKISIEKGKPHVVIDAVGKHLAPGMIDCHSHMATDGGINESGQTVTSEVRISDFIDPTDITIYRQLAGGVTSANILHGSANPIGGQNQVIKLRWGDSMNAMRFEDAPAGIKFALGENVKRSSSRYPNSRMGVEQLLRDQFLAAREYAVSHRRWEAGQRGTLPPRVDLQLQALAEVQDGTRWIHCHSYRQDEIIATLGVLDEFGIRIGTLQHILEGYKVADAMAKHGAMASSFADWWAYKFEVYDAIPYNGVLMHRAGIVVSYNSDDPELGRHLNTEAAKAVKYGGVSPTEALKFVTLNPAKQLRIENRVGSIEVGKDADLVLWSGPPLSTMSVCEQTWIDGRQIFDQESNAELFKRDNDWRNELIQLVLDGGPKPKPNKEDGSKKSVDHDARIAEEDRWLRFDEYCNSQGARQKTITQQNTGVQQNDQSQESGVAR